MKKKKSEETAKFNAANLFVDHHVHQGRGDRVALYYQDQQITYGKVFEKVNQIGNALKDLGLNMEDRVMLLLLDCPEFIYTFFGVVAQNFWQKFSRFLAKITLDFRSNS